MKFRAVLALVGACAAAAVIWPASRFFLERAQASMQSPPSSFHPPATVEPIAPIPRSLPLDSRKVALGKRLFHDARLSRDGNLSCASCHSLAKGGADGLPRSRGMDGIRTARNAPTVFNTAFNFAQFWDGRAASLEDQVDGPLENVREMATSWPAVIAKLREDGEYRAAFDRLYGAIGPEHVRNAIAEFERSLITPGSRFDRYLEGDTAALTLEEIKGYQRFKSYGCVACHQGVNVGGNLYQALGLHQSRTPEEMPEVGRMAVTRNPDDFLVFKVPGLRNVALTAPYFHDGSVATLEEAVRMMGRQQLGLVLPAVDVELIVQFLHTLTGVLEEKAP